MGCRKLKFYFLSLFFGYILESFECKHSASCYNIKHLHYYANTWLKFTWFYVQLLIHHVTMTTCVFLGFSSCVTEKIRYRGACRSRTPRNLRLLWYTKLNLSIHCHKFMYLVLQCDWNRLMYTPSKRKFIVGVYKPPRSLVCPNVL